MKILISGYYGFKNIGDEAILKVLIDDLKSLYTHNEITVISQYPELTKKHYNVHAVFRENIEQIDEQIRVSDLIILGGGGLFQDHYKLSPVNLFNGNYHDINSYFLLVPLLAKIYQKPLIYYAHGVGPLFSYEAIQFSKFAFNIADKISVRDKYSYNLLNELLQINMEKVRLTIDPAFKLEPVYKECVLKKYKIPENKKIIAVSLRMWKDKRLETQCVESMTNFLKILFKNNDFYVVFLSFQEFKKNCSDSVVLKKVYKHFNRFGASLHCIIDPLEVLSIIANSYCVIGMRYHSIVFALKCTIPVIAIAYDVKVRNIMNEFGLNDFVIDMDSINPDIMLNKFQTINTDYNFIINNINNSLSILLNKSFSSTEGFSPLNP